MYQHTQILDAATSNLKDMVITPLTPPETVQEYYPFNKQPINVEPETAKSSSIGDSKNESHSSHYTDKGSSESHSTQIPIPIVDAPKAEACNAQTIVPSANKFYARFVENETTIDHTEHYSSVDASFVDSLLACSPPRPHIRRIVERRIKSGSARQTTTFDSERAEKVPGMARTPSMQRVASAEHLHKRSK